jgi:hypothetical protein
MYVWIYTSVCIYTDIRIYKCVCLYICTYIYTQMYTYIYIAICSCFSAAVSSTPSAAGFQSDSSAGRPRRYRRCAFGRMCASFVQCVSVRLCLYARAFVCECLPRRLCWHSRGLAWTGGIYRTACDGRTAACAVVVCVIGRFAREAAGVTWTSRTTSAQWAGRQMHTTVIDATGAIYVIGGVGGGTVFNDVLVSTDGGADRTWAVLGGTRGYSQVFGGTKGVLRALEGYSG